MKSSTVLSTSRSSSSERRSVEFKRIKTTEFNSQINIWLGFFAKKVTRLLSSTNWNRFKSSLTINLSRQRHSLTWLCDSTSLDSLDHSSFQFPSKHLFCRIYATSVASWLRYSFSFLSLFNSDNTAFASTLRTSGTALISLNLQHSCTSSFTSSSPNSHLTQYWRSFSKLWSWCFQSTSCCTSSEFTTRELRSMLSWSFLLMRCYLS